MRIIATVILSLYLAFLSVLGVVAVADPPSASGWRGVFGLAASVIAGLPWSLPAVYFGGFDATGRLFCWLGALINLFILCLVCKATAEATISSPSIDQKNLGLAPSCPFRKRRRTVLDVIKFLVYGSLVLLLVLVFQRVQRTAPDHQGQDASNLLSHIVAGVPSPNERAAGEEWALSEGATKPEQCTGSIYFVEGCIKQVKRASAGNSSSPP